MAGYVQVGLNENTLSSGSTVSFTTQNTAKGNLFCLLALNQGGSGFLVSSVTDSQNNSWTACPGATCSGSPGGNFTAGQAWYASNTYGGTKATVTVNWTGSSASVGLYLFELSGVGAFDVGGGDTGTTGTADAGTFTTRYGNEIIVAATINLGGASAAGTGYTLIQITGGFADALVFAVVNTGSQSPTVGMTGATDWGMIAAAFYPVPEPPGVVVSAAGSGW